MNYILTNNGAVLMTQVAAGRTILFTRTESGSGYAANPAVLQNVIDKKQDMFLEEVIFENRQAVVKTVLSNMQLEEGYQLRQVGVYAKLEGDETDTLVVIGQQYNGEKIPPYGEGIIQIEYDIAMKVSGTGNVTIEGVGTGYVTKGQFLAHLSDYNNPHKVTAKQVGLDKVPNIGTDDQTPKFEEAEERENITSEEKLSVIFGKIRKWLSDLKAAAFCSVANNLVTTLPGSVLDARQGKELEDQISGLYSDIQMLRNDLSALDTRVTNAITGGDLVPPYTLDLSVLSYKDEIHGQNSSVTQSRMAVAADSQNGTGYVIRRFSTTFTVPKKGKIKINLSRYNKDSYTTGIPITVHVYALDPSSSHESNNLLSKSIKIDGEDSLDLSSLAGRNIKVTLGMTRSGGTIYNTCGITINSLIVTNQ